jgi:hypothetical protein
MIALAFLAISLPCFTAMADSATESAASKFVYDCANRPFAHPYYGRAGLLGVCSTAVSTPQGPVTVTHEAKNPEWALWLVVNEVCFAMNHEIIGLEYDCAWKPSLVQAE